MRRVQEAFEAFAEVATVAVGVVVLLGVWGAILGVIGGTIAAVLLGLAHVVKWLWTTL